MQSSYGNKISELKLIISQMPLEMCATILIREFGVRWREVSSAIRNARLPMAPESVARVLCRHIAKTLTVEEVAEILSRLRLKLVATQRRNWNVITLKEKTSDEPLHVLMRELHSRIRHALRGSKGGRNMRPQIQTATIDDFIYISIQMVSDVKESGILYVAIPPGQDVALVSSLQHSTLTACVKGLGYNKFEDAALNGQDKHSLVRIYNSHNNENAEFLARIPELTITPYMTSSGIDFTGRKQYEEYADQILGPNPPLLNKLMVTAKRRFYDPERFNKEIKIKLELKSEDVAKTLKHWFLERALAPNSELLKIVHVTKSNKIQIESDEE